MIKKLWRWLVGLFRKKKTKAEIEEENRQKMIGQIKKERTYLKDRRVVTCSRCGLGGGTLKKHLTKEGKYYLHIPYCPKKIVIHKEVKNNENPKSK